MLTRGKNHPLSPALLLLMRVDVDPALPHIASLDAAGGVRSPDANNFFKGRAEAVLALSSLDPSGNNKGSFAFVVSGKSDAQAANPPTEAGAGRIIIQRNAWGNRSATDPNNPLEFLHFDEILGLTGPVSVAIDDTAQEVIVVEQTEDGEGAQECAVGQSPLRFISLATGEEVLSKRLCIDGVGDSADIEVDRGFGRNRAFIARSFSEGGVAVIDLNTYTEWPQPVNLYPAGEAQPAPGLELDLAAHKGCVASPDLLVPGVREFDLGNPTDENQWVNIQGDVYYHRNNGIATGLQEVTLSNFNNQNQVRRGLVISRGDPNNYPNRADEATRINLVTHNTNRRYTKYQTTNIALAPQRANEQTNKQFFLRILTTQVDSALRMMLKQYETSTNPGP